MKIRLSLKNIMRLIAISMVLLFVAGEQTAQAAGKSRSTPLPKPQHITPIEPEEQAPTKPPRKKTTKVDANDGGWESGEIIETIAGVKSKQKPILKDTGITAPTDSGVDFEPKPMPRKQVPVPGQPLLHQQPPITSQPKTWQPATPIKSAPSYAGPTTLSRSQSTYGLPRTSVKDDSKPLRRTQSFTYGTGKVPSGPTSVTTHTKKQPTSPLASIKADELLAQKARLKKQPTSPLASIKADDLLAQKERLKKTNFQEESFQDRFKRLYPNKKLRTQPVIQPVKEEPQKHKSTHDEESSKPTPAKDSDQTPTDKEKKDEAKAKKGGISGAVQMGGIGMAGLAMLTMLPMVMGDPSMQAMMQMMLTMGMQGSGQMGQMAGGMQMDMTSLIAALVKQNVPASAPVVNALQDIRSGASVSDAILKQLPPDVQQKILVAEDVLKLIQGKDSVIGDQANKMLAETQANITAAINKTVGDIQTQIDTTIKQANDTLESVLSQPEQIIAAATGQILNTTNLVQTTIEQGKVIVASEINRMTKIVDKAQQDIDLGLKTIDQVQQDIIQGLSTTLTAPANVIKIVKSDPEIQTYVAHLLGFIVDVSGQLAAAQEAEKQRIQEVKAQVKQTKDLAQEVLKDTAALAIAQGKAMAVNKLLSVLKENGILLPDSDDAVAQIQAQVSDNIDKSLVDVRARVDANTQEIEKSLSAILAMPKQLLVTIADRINLAAQAAQANIAQGAMNVTSINTVMQNMKKSVAEGTKTVEEAQAAVTKYLAQMLAMPTTLATKVRKHNGVSNYIGNLLDIIENLSGQVRDANIRDNQQVDAAQKEFSDTDALVKEAVADAATAAALAINTTVAAAVAPFMATIAATQQKAQAQAQAQKPATTPAPAPAPIREPQLPQMPQRLVVPSSNTNATA